jgi:hypothetical protein
MIPIDRSIIRDGRKIQKNWEIISASIPVIQIMKFLFVSNILFNIKIKHMYTHVKNKLTMTNLTEKNVTFLAVMTYYRCNLTESHSFFLMKLSFNVFSRSKRTFFFR